MFLGVTSKFRWLDCDCFQPFAKGGKYNFFNLSHYERQKNCHIPVGKIRWINVRLTVNPDVDMT